MSPDKSEYTVDLEAMLQVVAKLTKFRAELDAQLQQSQHIVMALGSDWSGDAREAQVEFFRKLKSGMLKINEGITDFKDGIGNSHDVYREALDTNLRMWNG